MFGLLLSIVINILSLGAQPGDENINNAPIINQAIHQCTEAGGGTVVIPSGEFTTGCIYLQSGVKLHLEQGTVNYNSATDPQWSLALIHGIGISHSGIEGEGCIDGNNVRNALGEEGMRGPHTLLLASCDNCKVEDFEVKNSANYAFLGYLVNHTSFTHLRI